jgi:hypothetical protein
MSTSERRFPARFDPDPWEQDLARSTSAGQTAGETARRDYEADGVPRSHLKLCEQEGRDGTNLPQCFKVYAPYPNGRFGIVFTIDGDADKPTLMFLAFGVRHHPPSSHAPTVYKIAHNRLHDQEQS